MLILINDRRLMGEHVNSRGFNGIAIALSVLITLLTIFSGALVLVRR
jgi:Mn2+/Fe2+ NRAMP family transporter